MVVVLDLGQAGLETLWKARRGYRINKLGKCRVRAIELMWRVRRDIISIAQYIIVHSHVE